MRLAKHLSTIAAAVCLLYSLAAASTAAADWQPDGSKLQNRTYETIQRIREDIPKTGSYFEDAAGFVVFPRIGRFGYGIGGSYGKGLVFERDSLIGESKFWQFTSGIQAGLKSFSMIIFFRDRNALDEYRRGTWQFMGQAGVTLGPVGVDGTPAYNDGVAIFALTRFGLMGEFTISFAKLTYKDLSGN